MTSEKKLPPDANVEPTREVLRRLYMGFSSFSVSRLEPVILARAYELAKQGWLVDTGSYPCAGQTYTQFKASDRLDVKALKDL